MKRKSFIILLSILLIFVCAFSFMACEKNNGEDNADSDGADSDGAYSDSADSDGAYSDGKLVTVSGTYYEVYNDEIDEDTYIRFVNATWTDDGDVSGTFVIEGNVITLYLTIDGEKDEYASGVIEDDEITFDDDTVYRKGEDITQKPKRLDFELSEDKSYYIVKGIGGLSGDIVVPETYKQKPVKEIAEKAFTNNSNLTSIVLPTSVDTLGERAFYKCRNLLSVEILGSLQVITTDVFSGCDSMTSVTIPAVKEIQMDAFKDCSDLEEVIFLGTVSQWCMIDFKDGYEGGIDGGTTYYSNPLIVSSHVELIIDGEVVTDITIDASEIKANVFSGYKLLKTVTFTSSVTKIGDNAFSRCSNLTSVDMKDSKVESIGNSAFYNDSAITTVTFSQTLEYIYDSAFNECRQLTAVEFGDSLEKIGDFAFLSCANLKSVSLGSSVITIGNSAFKGCAYESITIPNSVTFIGGEAFFSSSLKSATFERKSGWKVNNTATFATMTEIDEASLDSPATMANYLTNKGYPQIAVYDWYVDTLIYKLSSDGTYYSVRNNSAISTHIIVIPEKYNNIPVEVIYSNAFQNCSRLTSIVIPSSVKQIGSNAFDGCSSLTGVYITDIASWCAKNFANYTANPLYYAENLYLNNELVTDLEIPSSVTSIGYSAFYNCSSLTSVTIPSSVTNIDWYAFSGCSSLTSVEIPSSVTSIGYDAFSGCSSLTSVTIPSSVTSIGSDTFWGCSSLISIEIPSSVTSIGNYAFSGCSSLTSIEIPNSVTSIGDRAFAGCRSLIIYCEAESIPGGWDSSWNSDGCPVVLNCKNNDVATDGYIYYVDDYGIKYALKDGVVTVLQQSDKISGDIVILGQITYKGTTYNVTIGFSAFSGCSSLTSVVISSGVTSIGNYAFYYCSSLTSVVISSGVTSIGNYAFSSCSSLTSVMIPSSVTSIGSYVFNDCSSLTIYCEADMPSEWDASWSKIPVVWGYKQR